MRGQAVPNAEHQFGTSTAKGNTTVTLGLILLIIGLIVNTGLPLVTIGIILIVVGLILNLVPLGGRRIRVW